MKLFIVSGASSGLGLALTQLALTEGNIVIGISRRAALKHENFYSLKHDLSKPSGIEKKLDRILEKINLKKVKSVHLINNAATIEPVSLVGKFSVEGIQKHLELNLSAPLILSNYAIKTFKKKAHITNIVSGAALRPISGWSLYCSTKSGLRMFSECLVAEGVKAISFSPGVMDTSMQATIRKQKIKDFGEVRKFQQYKQKNILLPAEEVAALLIGLLSKPDSIDRIHYSVNELR